MLADTSSPWNALTNPAWFDCESPEEVKAKAREMSGWPNFPALEDEWTQAVIRAMGPQEALWNRLVVFHVLEEAARRGWPLGISKDGKDVDWSTLGAPQWLQNLRADQLASGAQERAEREAFSLARSRLMSATSPASYREDIALKTQRDGKAPMFQGAFLSVALLVSLQSTLESYRFRDSKGKVRSQSEGRRAEMNARWLRGLLRWVDHDANGPAREAALVVGWAAATWFHRNERAVALKKGIAGRMEENQEHYQTAISLAQKLLAKTGVRTPEDYQRVALWALQDSPWGNALKTIAAEILAMSWGSAWGAGSEVLWAQSLKQLAGEPETHWVHYPSDPTAEVPGRHVIRKGINALVDPLLSPALCPPEDILSALEGALEPRWITEALAQVWLGSRTHSGTGAFWDHGVAQWLAKAPEEDVRYWPTAVLAAWRQQDGDREVLLAQAREQMLQAQLLAAEQSVPSRPRTRL